MHSIASADVELARLAVSVPWFVDGVTYYELISLRQLGNVAGKDTELARSIASFPWFADGSFDGQDASVALGELDRIASTDIELARKIAGLWLANGVSRHEANSLVHLIDLALKDIELARRIAEFSWLADGTTEEEAAALRLLNQLAAFDIEFAREVGGHSWFEDRGTFSAYILNSLNSLVHRAPDALSKLTSRPWFADGLDDEEAALVVTLGWVVARSPELYADLLRTHYTRYRAFSLPVAGDVNIWVFQNTPFPPHEDLLAVIEDTARISERFLGVPFPTNDIILLVVDDVDRRYGFYATKFLASFMVATRRPGGLRSVRHETAHYYFNSAPQWLTEGGAEFIVAYVKDRTGVQSMSDRRTEVSQEVRSQCFDLNEIENIRHFTYLWGRSGHICPYAMGENLLHNVYEVFGEDVLASALGELTGLMLARELTSGIDRERENLVFDTFLKHIPTERTEEFLNLYRRLHGGPYEEPGVDLSDDHGDEATVATDIAVGEVTEGSLDYHFDFDYFKFRAEEGQRYLISVNHETLRSSSLLLYGPDGQTREGYLDRARVSFGPQMRWIAPAFGDYYFAIQNFGGKSGSYTTTIASVAPIPDDHGDSAAAATDISVGEIVEGIIDHSFDFDFFRIQAVAGQKYRFVTQGVTLLFSRVDLYEADGVTWTEQSAESFLNEEEQRETPVWGGWHGVWIAPSSGEYYLAAQGVYGHVGTYRLIVSESDSPWVDLTP